MCFAKFFVIFMISRAVRTDWKGVCEMKHIQLDSMANYSGTTNLSNSLSLMDSLGSVGLVIAPGGPAKSMLHAGAAVGGISTQLAEYVYKAMIQAED
jgi:hypothetical protein